MLHRASGFFFMVLLQLILVFTFLYLGLNMAEQGIQQLLGLKEEGQAFRFLNEEKGLVIIFAGRQYLFPWKEYRVALDRYFYILSCRYLNYSRYCGFFSRIIGTGRGNAID